MARLIVSTQMTLDAVIDSTDRWFAGDGDDQQAHASTQLRAAEALLLGRKTYQGLARVWPTITDDRGFADRVNALPKFVASRTLTGQLDWNAGLIEGDLATAVGRLKQELPGDLLSFGCGELANALLRYELVDELRFHVHPVLFGAGTRPLGLDSGVGLRLVDTTTFSSGVVLLSYRPYLAAESAS